MIEYQAIRVKVAGHNAIGLKEDVVEYQSKLEARVARLLLKASIHFTPHVRFECVLPNGEQFSYTIDFLLEYPQKFTGIRDYVLAIEVKGRLRPFDFRRIEALKYCHDVRAYIVTSPLVEYWEENGF